MRAYFGFIFDFVCVCVFLISWVTFWAVKRIFVFIKDGKQKFRPHLFSLSQSSFFDKQCAMLVGLLVLLASCSATSTYPFLRFRKHRRYLLLEGSLCVLLALALFGRTSSCTWAACFRVSPILFTSFSGYQKSTHSLLYSTFLYLSSSVALPCSSHRAR